MKMPHYLLLKLRLFGRIPVSFTLYKFRRALFFDFSQVLKMCFAVMRLKNFERFTCGKIVALPATLEFFLSDTISDFTHRRPAVTSTCSVAAHFHHCAQKIIAFIIVFEFFEKGDLCQHVRHEIKSVMP